MLRPILLLIVGLWGGVTLYTTLFQSRMVYYPSRTITATPAEYGFAYEDVKLRTSDGLTIAGWFVPHPSPRMTVLFCHGNAGNMSNRLDTVRVMHDIGLSVLIFDYRGYGESEGSPSEQGTYRDAGAAWRWLTDTKGIDPDDIIVWGRSLGGAIAVQRASQDTPGALVVESSFISIPELGHDIYPWLPVRTLSRIHYPTVDMIGGVRCPVMVIHSTTDQLIPVRHGRAIYEAAPDPKTFLEISGNHNNAFLTSEEKYTGAVSAFIAGLERER